MATQCIAAAQGGCGLQQVRGVVSRGGCGYSLYSRAVGEGFFFWEGGGGGGGGGDGWMSRGLWPLAGERSVRTNKGCSFQEWGWCPAIG